jgi:putative transcriptional regulator
MSPARFRLQELIDERGMTQAELATTSGVSLSTVNRMCRNATKQASLDTLDRIARALGVAPGALIESTAEPSRRRR